MTETLTDGFLRRPLVDKSPGSDRYTTNRQRLYRFPNGWGASVVTGEYSYGGGAGLWELAVLSWAEPSEDLQGWSLDYSTPITNDVIGWLTPAQVEEKLDLIEALPANAAVS